MSDRYLEPTRASRIKLAVAVMAYIAVYVAMELWWTPFMSYVRALPLCEGLQWLRGLAIAFLLMFAAASFSAARAGILTLQAGQSPFPGAWIWSRTRVRTGVRAKLNGWGFLAVAALMAVAPVAIGYALKVNVIFCVPDSCGCG